MKMPRKQLFKDAFWGPDFCGAEGHETIVRRLKDGRDMCKEIEEFLKQRGKIEDEYARSLTKLAKIQSNVADNGTFRHSWECLKAQTEQIASEHSNVSMAFIERAKSLATFIEGQKYIRKQEEDTVKNSWKKKVSLFRKNIDYRRTYENKCRELENIAVQIANHKQAGSNIDKLQAKETKVKQEKEKADNQYQDLVKQLENARLTWERDMVQLCEEAEKLELDRLNYLQNELWSHTNQISLCCVADDQHCELMRQEIEKCNSDADLDMFVVEKSTGTQRPSEVRYMPYHENDVTYHQHPHRPVATMRPPPPQHAPR